MAQIRLPAVSSTVTRQTLLRNPSRLPSMTAQDGSGARLSGVQADDMDSDARAAIATLLQQAQEYAASAPCKPGSGLTYVSRVAASAAVRAASSAADARVTADVHTIYETFYPLPESSFDVVLAVAIYVALSRPEMPSELAPALAPHAAATGGASSALGMPPTIHSLALPDVTDVSLAISALAGAAHAIAGLHRRRRARVRAEALREADLAGHCLLAHPSAGRRPQLQQDVASPAIPASLPALRSPASPAPAGAPPDPGARAGGGFTLDLAGISSLISVSDAERALSQQFCAADDSSLSVFETRIAASEVSQLVDGVAPHVAHNAQARTQQHRDSVLGGALASPRLRSPTQAPPAPAAAVTAPAAATAGHAMLLQQQREVCGRSAAVRSAITTISRLLPLSVTGDCVGVNRPAFMQLWVRLLAALDSTRMSVIALDAAAARAWTQLRPAWRPTANTSAAALIGASEIFWAIFDLIFDHISTENAGEPAAALVAALDPWAMGLVVNSVLLAISIAHRSADGRFLLPLSQIRPISAERRSDHETWQPPPSPTSNHPTRPSTPGSPVHTADGLQLPTVGPPVITAHSLGIDLGTVSGTGGGSGETTVEGNASQDGNYIMLVHLPPITAPDSCWLYGGRTSLRRAAVHVPLSGRATTTRTARTFTLLRSALPISAITTSAAQDKPSEMPQDRRRVRVVAGVRAQAVSRAPPPPTTTTNAPATSSQVDIVRSELLALPLTPIRPPLHLASETARVLPALSNGSAYDTGTGDGAAPVSAIMMNNDEDQALQFEISSGDCSDDLPPPPPPPAPTPAKALATGGAVRRSSISHLERHEVSAVSHPAFSYETAQAESVVTRRREPAPVTIEVPAQLVEGVLALFERAERDTSILSRAESVMGFRPPSCMLASQITGISELYVINERETDCEK